MSEAITGNPVLPELPLPGLTPTEGALPLPGGTGFDQALRQFIQAQTGKGESGPQSVPGFGKLPPPALSAVGNILPLQHAAAAEIALPLSEALARLQWQTAEGLDNDETTEDLMAETLLSESDQETLALPDAEPALEESGVEESGAEQPLASIAEALVQTDEQPEEAPQVENKERSRADKMAEPNTHAEAVAAAAAPVNMTDPALEAGTGAVAKVEPGVRTVEGNTRQTRTSNRAGTDELTARSRAQEVLAAASDAEDIEVDEEDWASRLEEVWSSKHDIADAAQAKKQDAQPVAAAKGMQIRELAMQLNPVQDAEAVEPPHLGQLDQLRSGPLTQGPGSSQFQTLTLNTPIHKNNWGDAFGARITWLVKNELQGAELRLNPPHLGQINVRIDINDDQASIVFNAQNSTVRDAVEAAIPRLREMLGESGLNLANVDVSQQGFGQQGQGQAPQDDRLSGPVMPEYGGENEAEGENGSEVYTSDGLVDYFA